MVNWQYQPSPLEGQLEGFLQRRMGEGPPELDFDLRTETPAIQRDLMEQVRRTIAGEDIGIHPQQRQAMLEQIQRPLAAERRQAQRRAGTELARRGMGDSTVADQMLSTIERDYGRQLGDARREITMQDLQQRLQQQQQAQQLGAQLGQMEHQREAGNLERMLQHWAQQQQMEWQPFEGAMQYITGIHQPQQQLDQQQAMQQAQQRQALYEGLGMLAGGFMGGPAGGAIGQWLAGQLAGQTGGGSQQVPTYRPRGGAAG